MGFYQSDTSRRHRQAVAGMEHQEVRCYVPSSGQKVHYERLKPQIGLATEWAVRNPEEDHGDEKLSCSLNP